MRVLLLAVALSITLPTITSSNSLPLPPSDYKSQRICNLNKCFTASIDTHPNDLITPTTPAPRALHSSTPTTPILSASKSAPSILPDQTTSHVMMIDAGSTGTRLHIYEFSKRSFSTLPPPLSYPFAEESKWTSRVAPGISSYNNLPPDQLDGALRSYLQPFIDFTKNILRQKSHEWGSFPIYLKATGGMRALSTEDRNTIMSAIRAIFSDNNFNPFLFKAENARVISGEEEAIYGWAGINFLMGTLLGNTVGVGTVEDVNKTYGALDMGGV